MTTEAAITVSFAILSSKNIAAHVESFILLARAGDL